jgi:hypothetical protein
VATKSQRQQGTEAAAKVEGLLERVCLHGEGEGGSRSSGSSLNRNQERRRRGEAEGLGGGWRLPLMAAAISAWGLRKGNNQIEQARVNCLNWPAEVRRNGRGKVAGRGGNHGGAGPGEAEENKKGRGWGGG